MDDTPRTRDGPPAVGDAMGERGVLLGLSYRLLGSLVDAEDAVQETYVRWYRLSEEQRREISVPEPMPAPGRWTSLEDGRGDDPATRVGVDESVSMALLVVLDSMTPAERVAFILHDVFRYTFPEVADIVGRKPAACRQLASSGRRRVRSARAAPAVAGRSPSSPSLSSTARSSTCGPSATRRSSGRGAR